MSNISYLMRSAMCTYTMGRESLRDFDEDYHIAGSLDAVDLLPSGSMIAVDVAPKDSPYIAPTPHYQPMLRTVWRERALA